MRALVVCFSSEFPSYMHSMVRQFDRKWGCFCRLRGNDGLLTTLRATKTLWRTGTQYATVFPLPVFALQRISFPSKAKGIALACTSVGFAKDWSANARSIRTSSLAIEEKVSSSIFSSNLGGSVDMTAREAELVKVGSKGESGRNNLGFKRQNNGMSTVAFPVKYPRP